MRLLCNKRPSVAVAALWIAVLAACSDSTVRTNHAMIAFDPLSLDFGRQDAGGSRLRTLKVTNEGTRDLAIEKWEILDDARHAFTAADVPTVVPAGSNATISVTYLAPALEGPDGARLVFTTNADNAPEAQVSLAGRSELPCGTGEIFCGGTCFDAKTTNDHCGKCDVACSAPETCIAGTCACIPKSCEALHATCGTLDDGCGGTLDCGNCTGSTECFEGRCVAPTCRDGRKNGTETDVDCGGSACPGCAIEQHCRVTDDCGGGLVCNEGLCAPCTARTECPRGQICSDQGVCTGCARSSQCDADEACVAGACLSCPSEAAFNECGLCGGPPVPAAGQNCVAATGCISSFTCNSLKNGVVCAPVAVNECGLCGGAAVPGIGTECTLPNGCTSRLACNDLKNGTTCAPVQKNACGTCGGPALPLLGTPCLTDSGCPSTYVCDPVGTGVVCAPLAKNECGLCGGPPVAGLGGACTLVNGCDSTLVCNDQKNAATCRPVAKNECGLCGGSPVSNAIGSACTAGGCASSYVCNAAKTDVECAAVAKNECGKCGGPPVTDLGSACTSSQGCSSTRICNSTGTGSVCDTANQNACGLCAGPVINDLGASCTDAASGCTSQMVCRSTKDATVCQSVAKNACNKCGGPAITDLGAACTDSVSGCASAKTCNAAGDATVCQSVAKNQCGKCGGPAVTNLGQACSHPTSGCSGTYVCNGTNDGATCNAPASCGGTTTAHLVISEISGYGYNGGNDEFIELYNPTGATVDATNYTLWYHSQNSAGSWNRLAVVPAAKASVGRGKFLLATYDNANFSERTRVAPDFTYSASNGNLDLSSGTVALLKPNGSSAATSYNTSLVVDLVGYGPASVIFEGSNSTVEPSVFANASSVVRKATATSTTASMVVFPSPGADATRGNGYDSDDNQRDFVNRDERDPQNSASPAQP